MFVGKKSSAGIRSNSCGENSPARHVTPVVSIVREIFSKMLPKKAKTTLDEGYEESHFLHRTYITSRQRVAQVFRVFKFATKRLEKRNFSCSNIKKTLRTVKNSLNSLHH